MMPPFMNLLKIVGQCRWLNLGKQHLSSTEKIAVLFVIALT